MPASHYLKRIQVYLPEELRYRWRMSKAYDQEKSDSMNGLKLIAWAIENEVSLDE